MLHVTDTTFKNLDFTAFCVGLLSWWSLLQNVFMCGILQIKHNLF